MSRIGKQPIEIPSGVDVTIADGNVVTVSGPRGSLTQTMHADMRLMSDEGRVRVERPDLVISDILMPTMDGYEFVRQLRADLRIAATKVVFTTATYHVREALALAAACASDLFVFR